MELSKYSPSLTTLSMLITSSEAMLFVLLDAFRFTVSDKEIVWNIATVRYPTVGKDGVKPELPLVVAPLHKKV